MTGRFSVPPPAVGLCEACRHTRVVETRAGSRFFLCQRSAVDPAFPRYPRLPVLRCRGFEPAEEPASTGRPEPAPE